MFHAVGVDAVVTLHDFFQTSKRPDTPKGTNKLQTLQTYQALF